MNKMEIYEASRVVPVEAQKPFNNGSFSGTDINPMWRIKKLTELFGPCGIGWYYNIKSERAETYGETVMAIVDIELYIKVDDEWSKPICGTGGNTLVKETRKGFKPSDEGYKMALTDALSVACKALGIGADIYFEKDNTKYSKDSEDTKQEAQQEELDPIYCEKCMKPIVGGTIRGEIYTANDIAEKSLEKYKRFLCYSCMKKEAAKTAERVARQ